LALLALAISPLGQAGRSNQTELRPRIFLNTISFFYRQDLAWWK